MFNGLSIIQPWASLIAIGAKRIETRSWKTDYRGPVAVHASKNFPDWSLCFHEPFRSALNEFRDTYSITIPTGAIIATATIADCVPVDLVPPDLLTEQERAFGNYMPGWYAWILGEVKRLQQPIQCRGALGLWTVPTEIEEQLDGAIGK
jgi:activating signal cointegrator 1